MPDPKDRDLTQSPPAFSAAASGTRATLASEPVGKQHVDVSAATVLSDPRTAATMPAERRDLLARGLESTCAAPAAITDQLLSPGAVTPECPGRYVIPTGVAQEIGRGGIGRVIVAFDNHIGRNVAVKELLVNDDDRSSVASSASAPAGIRFMREARVTGQLEHPSIVPVYEAGQREDGTLYYTMKLVRGETLAQRLASCATIQQRLALLPHYINVCQAIAYAHDRGVIHRDIKTANVMVGAFGETVVLDWGLAKVTGTTEEHDRPSMVPVDLMEGMNSLRTMDGSRLGTPAYMSPEQAHGRIAEVDVQSDVWSLGAVLHEMLAGAPPFTGDTFAEILVNIDRAKVDPRGAEPGAPPELCAICCKALSRSKADRYQSAGELAEDVIAYQSGLHVKAYDYSSWEQMRRFAARHRAAIATAAAILVTLVVALAAVSAMYGRELTASRAAHFHMAQALDEKASSLLSQGRYLESAVYAAASLLHNPASPGSPWFDSNAQAGQAGSKELLLDARSHLYVSRISPSPAFGVRLKADTSILSVAVSPDGRWLAAGLDSGVTDLWDLAARRRLHALAHRDMVQGVVFSPDGSVLYSSGYSRMLRAWDVASGRMLRESATDSDVRALASSPDGKLLASGGTEGKLLVWEAASGKLLRELVGHKGSVMDVAFSPDGRELASVGRDQLLRIWNPHDGLSIASLEGHSDSLNSVVWSPDGKHIASAGNDRTVRIWNSETRRLERELKHPAAVLSVDFLGSWVATGSVDRATRFFDLSTGVQRSAAESHTEPVVRLATSQHAGVMVSASYDRTLVVWNAPHPTTVRHTDALSSAVYDIAWSPDGHRLAVTGIGETLICDARTGKTSLIIPGHADVVHAAAWSPDGRWIATGGRDDLARITDARSGQTLRTFRGHTSWVLALGFSPDGSMLATGGRDGTTRLWDARTAASITSLQGHGNYVFALAFSPDGKHLVTASYDRTVRVWNVAERRTGRVLEHDDRVVGVAVSPDSRWIASASKNGKVTLWDLVTGTRLKVIAAHSSSAEAVQFSPDGRLIASVGEDQTARVWIASTGDRLLALPSNSNLYGLSFSPDGSELTFPHENTAVVYPIDRQLLTEIDGDPMALLNKAQRAAGVELDGFLTRPAVQ